MGDLSIYRGDTKTYSLAFQDGNGDAIDISGATIWFTAKSAKSDTDGNAVIQKTVSSHTDPTNGLSELTLTPSDTDVAVGEYFFDFQLVSAGGAVTTLTVGKLIVEQDITISTS